MRRTISLLTAVAAVVATMLASTSLAAAQGNPQGNPHTAENEAQAQEVGLAACDPGEGETSGDMRSDNPSTDNPSTTTNPNGRSFGAVQKAGGFGILRPPCSVTLPEAAQIIDEP